MVITETIEKVLIHFFITVGRENPENFRIPNKTYYRIFKCNEIRLLQTVCKMFLISFFDQQGISYMNPIQ